MKTFTFTIIGLAALFGFGVYSLPSLRNKTWSDLEERTIVAPVLPSAPEEEVASEMVTDLSVIDWKTDIRTIRTVPTSAVELEAAYRLRKNDECETLSPDLPLELTQFTSILTDRDNYRDAESRHPSTRRHILSVGLSVLDSDQRLLPGLSRSTIVSFLNDHFLSIQARITKEPVSGSWKLHYRPIAAVSQYKRHSLTTNWAEAIHATVRDIRGLGLVEGGSGETQTAAIIFRAVWLDENGDKAGIRNELGFIHARSVQGNPSEPLELHFFSTSGLRTQWHYFPPEKSSQMPGRPRDCSLVATVRFDAFAKNGLEPTSSSTRRMVANARKSFDIKTIEDFLSDQKLSGNWGKHVPEILEAIIDGKIGGASH